MGFDAVAPIDVVSDVGVSDTLPDITDVSPVDVPTDHSLDPDASCARATAMATIDVLPVDIIWIVDNSASMAPAVAQVNAGLNGFASVISSRGFDYHVVMISLRGAVSPDTSSGRTRYPVCVPPPLAGDSACGNSARFFHSNVDIRSTQPLEQLLGTLGQTTGYALGDPRGGEPWRNFLRADATKTIVIVSDDDSRFSAADFLHFAGGPNPGNVNVTLPPGLLDPSWSGLFANLTVDGLYGWGSDTDPTRLCAYPDGSHPANPGLVYTTLVTSTMGVRAHICDGATAWTPFFDSVASAVEHASRIACDVAIPMPPDGSVVDPTRINVVLNGATRTLLGNVANAAACSASGGWYYDNNTSPTRVILCPSSCDRAQSELRVTGRGIEVQFGCTTIPG